MKRYIFLAVLVLIGAAAALIYAMQPQDEITVSLEEGEDGSLSLVQVTSAPESESAPEEKHIKGVEFSHKAGFYAENISVELSAAKDAMNGWDPSYGSLYYYNPAVATSKWIFSRKTVVTIGSHVFAL